MLVHISGELTVYGSDSLKYRTRGHGTSCVLDIKKCEDEWFLISIINGYNTKVEDQLDGYRSSFQELKTDWFICDQIDGVLDCLNTELAK